MDSEQGLIRALVNQAGNSGWLNTSLIFLGLLIGNMVTVLMGWLSFKNKKKEVEGTGYKDLMAAQKELLTELREDNHRLNEMVRELTTQLTTQRSDYESRLGDMRQAMRDRVRKRERMIRELCSLLQEQGTTPPESCTIPSLEDEHNNE